MIGRALLCTFAAAVIIASLALVGWGVVTLIEHHLRFVIGFSICGLAAILYAELRPTSLEGY